MLLKILAAVVVFSLIYIIFFKKDREKNISKTKKQNDSIEDIMVECPSCSTYVSKKEGVLSNGKYFCSKECLENN